MERVAAASGLGEKFLAGFLISQENETQVA
jgi:hypothetical protein